MQSGFDLARVLIHGVVQGALSVAQGGSFLNGFAIGAAGEGADVGMKAEGLYSVQGEEGVAMRTAIAGVAGGTASVLTGGKFANGAVSAAFAHLFNDEGYHGEVCQSPYPAGPFVGGLFGIDNQGVNDTWSPLDFIAGGVSAGVRGVTSAVLDDSIPLFRAVMNGELESIEASGTFSNPYGFENKYFSTTLDGAQSYATQAANAFGDGPFSLVQTSFPKSMIIPDMVTSVDAGGIPTVVIPTNSLQYLSKPIILPKP